MTSEVPLDHLANPVASEADVERLDQAELRRLAQWVSSSLLATERVQGGRSRRNLVLAAATLCAVFLVPWVTLLASSLPNRVQTHEWRVAWVGFDIAMIAAFAATAWFGWRRRQLVITALLVTATLLLCDAWFDVTLSWGTKEQAASLATAALIEVPIAIFLLASYHRLQRVLVTQVRHERGDFGPPPPLWRQPLLLAAIPQGPTQSSPSLERDGDTEDADSSADTSRGNPPGLSE
jgi:hypothetical protein